MDSMSNSKTCDGVYLNSLPNSNSNSNSEFIIIAGPHRPWIHSFSPFSVSLSSIIRTSSSLSLSLSLGHYRGLCPHYFTPTPTGHSAHYFTATLLITSQQLLLITSRLPCKPPTHCSSLLHINAHLPSINFCNNPLWALLSLFPLFMKWLYSWSKSNMNRT